ncbi:MAG: helicase HerA-like domain-containing protein [Candidatus Micrarchaeota archaeon]
MENNPSLGVSGSDVISLPSKFLTRHGLIAGSTGTGKSRTMQVLAEQLSENGSSVFVSDVKGDASGFCVAGQENERNKLADYRPRGIQANYWSIGDRFAPIRFSVSSIGPVLISRLLCLNPTQESHLALAFSYARKEKKPLFELDQLLDILDEMVETNQRGMSKSSVSVIQRKIIALDESGVGGLFGKPSLSLGDLKGLNVLNLSNSRKDMTVAIAPAFLLQMLFDSLPEVGNVDAPKFAIFFDEAHYLFKDANKSLQNRMVTILKQIRSKGVSVFFVTQDVTDLPDEILSQLSTKIIFSQKVFTQKGNKRLKALANSFPRSEMDVLETLKRMPPGVAVVSTLDSSGNQTEPKEVRMFAPATTMDIVPDEVLIQSTDEELIRKYREREKFPEKAAPAKAPEKTAKAEKEKPARLEKPAKEGRQPKKKSGPSIWSGIFGFLLKLLDFILKAFGKLFSFLIFRPGKKYFKWMMKKKVRILYTLVFILILYIIMVNRGLIEGFLGALKF